jgi:hypothetical protein
MKISEVVIESWDDITRAIKQGSQAPGSSMFMKAGQPLEIKTPLGTFKKTATGWLDDEGKPVDAATAKKLDAEAAKTQQQPATTAPIQPTQPVQSVAPSQPAATKRKRPNSVKMPSGEIITYDYDSKIWTDDNDQQIVKPNDIARLNNMLRIKLQNYQMSN